MTSRNLKHEKSGWGNRRNSNFNGKFENLEYGCIQTKIKTGCQSFTAQRFFILRKNLSSSNELYTKITVFPKIFSY